jgi:histidinol dehydrogenase
VDRIVGPGNRWVAEAKRQVAGDVPIDGPEGPSELLVIADASADPDAVARELVAQAEHDPEACAVAIGVGEAVAEAIERALGAAIVAAPHRGVVEHALAARGAVLATHTLDEALDVAAAYAPEHLMLAIASPEDTVPRVRARSCSATT